MQKTQQGKIRTLRFSGTLKRSLKLAHHIVDNIYNKYLSSFLGFKDFWGDLAKPKPLPLLR